MYVVIHKEKKQYGKYNSNTGKFEVTEWLGFATIYGSKEHAFFVLKESRCKSKFNVFKLEVNHIKINHQSKNNQLCQKI